MRQFNGRSFSVSGSHWICGFYAEIHKEQIEGDVKRFTVVCPGQPSSEHDTLSEANKAAFKAVRSGLHQRITAQEWKEFFRDIEELPEDDEPPRVV